MCVCVCVCVHVCVCVCVCVWGCMEGGGEKINLAMILACILVEIFAFFISIPTSLSA